MFVYGAIMKRLSRLEMTELVTIQRNEPNRFVTPRLGHLEKRGLIEIENGKWRLTRDGEQALRKAGWGGML